MKIAPNVFRNAMRNGEAQIGYWLGFASANVAEAMAGCGYHWLLIDGEHAPNDLNVTLEQLRAVAPYATHPVVRIVEANVALVKRYLDIGAQTLLVPMVDTPEQAALMVQAMRYPPEGIRGMGSALARASRWNQVDDYLNQANNEMCLLVQAETVEAMGNLKAIAEVDGVDGVFFGPADLSASMGYRGQPSHPEVKKAILDGIATVRAAGKAPGILAADPKLAREYLDAGALFVAVGVDTTMLVKAATALRQQFVQTAEDAAAAPRASGGY
ncbi:4-hydroxy-2-oxoheptanedioate aldolase [Hydrogenophaga sp. 5NK40-0174]|uniref:4-hydroxy-2-oxoheptanedioate aldolase n=1 Tax=Hydrogenophaga sp. 5NK40-0174 TaxID=3127649 RepID=UPI0031089BA5